MTAAADAHWEKQAIFKTHTAAILDFYPIIELRPTLENIKIWIFRGKIPINFARKINVMIWQV